MEFRFESNGKTHKEVLEDICSCNQHCILKDLVLMAHLFDDRNLEQLKCIDVFKYERSDLIGKDIGWKKAIELWMSEGYAKKFAKAYSSDKKAREIYNEIMGRGD